MIQFVPEPESSKVLTLKYLPSLANRGMMRVGEIDISASLAVLMRLCVGAMTPSVLGFC